ncbi:hypothetical protein D3C76_1011910 [compost metagenome]
MPTQIARTGLLKAALRMTSSIPASRMPCIQSRIAPTPGKTILSACAINFGSLVTSTVAPTYSSALAAECRLPMP